MYAKAPYTVMQRAVHIHPTVSELLPTILSDLQTPRLTHFRRAVFRCFPNPDIKAISRET